MERSELLATIERIVAAELDVLDRDELADVLAAASRVRAWLDATDLRCSRRGRQLAESGRSEPSPSLIKRTGNRTAREAGQIERRDRVAEAMPMFENGLDDASVSAGHLDAIASATHNSSPGVRAAFAAHEAELLGFAIAEPVEMFTRRCRALVTELTTESTGNDANELDRQRAASKIRRWVDPDDGLHHTHAALDPLRDEMVWSAINRCLRRRQQHDGNSRTPWNQMQVDSLVDAVAGEPVRRPARPPEHATTPPAPATSDTPTNTPSDAAERAPSPAAYIARQLGLAVDRAMTPPGEPSRAAPPVPQSPAPPGEFDAHDDDKAHDDQTDDEATDDDAVLRWIEQRVPEISVLVDLSFLVDGLHVHGLCETEDGVPLPVSTIRRLCCDAEIIPITLGGDSVPLDLGRTARTVNRAQRRALRAMHRTCAHPDCDVPFSHTKIHHIEWWTRDRGPTDIDNLLPLCERHHHLVHEGGWTLTMTPDRTATWTRPDGTVHHQGTTVDRLPVDRTPIDDTGRPTTRPTESPLRTSEMFPRERPGGGTPTSSPRNRPRPTDERTDPIAALRSSHLVPTPHR